MPSIKGLLKRRPNTWVPQKLQSPAGLDEIKPAAIPSDGTHYFVVKVHAMRAKNMRVVHKTYYAAVRAKATLPVYMGEPLVTRGIATPDGGPSTKEALENVITGTFDLVGPVVFRGAATLEVDLYAVPARDLAAPYLQFVATLSKGLCAPWSTPAAALLEVFNQAVDGMGSETLLVGWDEQFEETGYWAIATAELPDGVTYQGRRLRAKGKVIEQAFMVISIDAPQTSDTWWTLVPEARDFYNEQVVKAQSVPDLDKALQICKGMVDGSPMLTRADKAAAQRTIDTEATVNRAAVKAREAARLFTTGGRAVSASGTAGEVVSPSQDGTLEGTSAPDHGRGGDGTGTTALWAAYRPGESTILVGGSREADDGGRPPLALTWSDDSWRAMPDLAPSLVLQDPVPGDDDTFSFKLDELGMWSSPRGVTFTTWDPELDPWLFYRPRLLEDAPIQRRPEDLELRGSSVP